MQPVIRLIEDAHRSKACVKLAMIAWETGTKVTWEAQTESISHNSSASDLLLQAYRKPWKHPYQA